MKFFAHIRSWLILTCLILLSQLVSAQVRVQWVIKVDKDQAPGDSIYLAGNFNNWNPADPRFLLLPHGNQYMLRVDSCTPGPISYKFTRGSWHSVECDSTGHSVDNHLGIIGKDTTIYIAIQGWKDRTTYVPRHTASPHVRVLPDSLWLPGLQSKRLLRIYLPEGYQRSGKRYPVIYMHDGQNLFDRESSGYGEWGVDECLDSLIRLGQPPCIVVGIDNSSRRIQEYLPFNSDEYGQALGDQYLSDLVKVIKPYIDKQYRTYKEREQTIIAGSSLGGLISYYALLRYPDVFAHAGVFSPSFWIAPGIQPMTDSLGKRFNGKCYFYIGEKEGKRYRDDMVAVADKLGAQSSGIIYSVIDPEGNHRETYWSKWFSDFYVWMMGNGFNRQVKTRQ